MTDPPKGSGPLAGMVTSKEREAGVVGGETAFVSMVATTPLAAPVTSATATSSEASTSKRAVVPGAMVVPGPGAVITTEGGSSGTWAIAAPVPVSPRLPDESIARAVTSTEPSGMTSVVS